ncbi:MAG: hypothetical protein ACKO96_32910, partial [Flammeovirgaceae bacterium]
HQTTNQPYELIIFQKSDEETIAKNLALQSRTDSSYERVTPDVIKLRDAKCALPNGEGSSLMSDCLPLGEGFCCPTTMINSKIVDELSSLAKSTKNRALLSGVAGAAV